MKDPQTYEEVEKFVLDYVDGCSDKGIIKLYELITGKRAEIDIDKK